MRRLQTPVLATATMLNRLASLGDKLSSTLRILGTAVTGLTLMFAFGDWAVALLSVMLIPLLAGLGSIQVLLDPRAARSKGEGRSAGALVGEAGGRRALARCSSAAAPTHHFSPRRWCLAFERWPPLPLSTAFTSTIRPSCERLRSKRVLTAGASPRCVLPQRPAHRFSWLVSTSLQYGASPHAPCR